MSKPLSLPGNGKLKNGPKCGSSKPNVYTCGYSDALEAVGDDGQFPVPTGNGLGVSYDWEFIRKAATNQAVFE